MLELEVETGGGVTATVRVDAHGRVTHVELDDETEEVYATWGHFCEAVDIEDTEGAFEKIEDQIDSGILEEVKAMDLDSVDAILAECARKMAEPVNAAPPKTAPAKTAPPKTARLKAVPVKTPPKVQAKKTSAKKAEKAKVPPKAKKTTASKPPKKAKARKR